MGLENFIVSLYPNSTKKRIKKQLNKYGSNYVFDVNSFLSIRIYVCLILFVTLTFTLKDIVIPIIVTFIAYVLFEVFVLEYGIKRRKRIVEKDAIEFFSLLLLTIKSGKPLKQSIELVIDNLDNIMCDEFKNAFIEMKKGKSFGEAINNMEKYIPSSSVIVVLDTLKESYELGTPLEETIENMLEYLKEKRTLLARERINKINIKASVVTVLIYVPIILIILLAPAILAMIK